MFHFKKNIKILNKMEGSIIAQNINEETSNFAEYYSPAEVQIKTEDLLSIMIEGKGNILCLRPQTSSWILD